MKNAAAEMFYTKQIHKQKPQSKTFFRFIATFQQMLSQDQVLINGSLKLKLINQPISEDIILYKPKQQTIVFAQVVQQNKLLQGQIRKVTIEQALKYESNMKKLKYKTFEKVNMIGSKGKSIEQEEQKKNKPLTFGQRNGGFYQHF